MIATGVRAHSTTTRAGLPLLLESSRPLILNISFGDAGKFLGDVQYDVAKAAVTRLAFALACKLKPLGITALTFYPGFTRTERVKRGASDQTLADTHTPRFVGRAVIELASDPAVMKRTGQALSVGHLGLEYGFTDIDGSQPQPYSIPDSYGA
jgi:NAD(P)-dependent dehydrogenase (short-subunit alcohol dehydrogenase family)